MRKTNLKFEGYENYLIEEKNMFNEDFINKKTLYGKGWLFKFDNNYGVSVIKHQFSMGYNDNLFEIAEVFFKKDEFTINHSSVTGYLNNDEVILILEKVKNYKKHDEENKEINKILKIKEKYLLNFFEYSEYKLITNIYDKSWEFYYNDEVLFNNENSNSKQLKKELKKRLFYLPYYKSNYINVLIISSIVIILSALNITFFKSNFITNFNIGLIISELIMNVTSSIFSHKSNKCFKNRSDDFKNYITKKQEK